MKMLIIAGMAAVLGSVATVRADHALLPPRAAQIFPHMGDRSAGSDANLVNRGPMGPAAKSPTTRETVARTSGSGPDLLHRPVYTGKTPFQRTEQFEIAPVGKGKACEPGCSKECCAKK